MSLLLLLAAPGFAQGFDAHGFTLAAFDGDIRDPLILQRPDRFQQWDWFAGGLFEYAREPLVFATPLSNGDITYAPVLDNLVALNLSVGVAPLSRLKLDLSMPLYFASQGLNQTPQGFGVGDGRLSAMAVLVRPEADGGLGLGIVPYLTLPLGNPDENLGDSKLGGGGAVAATYEAGKLTVGGELGVDFGGSPDLGNLTNNRHLTAGVGVGYLITDHLGANLELNTALPFEQNTVSATDAPTEATLSVRGNTESGLHWTAGGALGVVRGASAAQYRLFLGAGFGKNHDEAPVVVDADGDGILDVSDACVQEPENINQYKDEDGCPDVLASLEVAVKRDGRMVPEAQVVLEGVPTNGSYTTEAGKTANYADLIPGGAITARASKGECLTGNGTLTLKEGTNSLVIELEPRLPADLKIEVVGPDGKPVPGAIAQFEKSAKTCAPSESIALGPDGMGTSKLGLGSHTLLVSAPQFATASAEVVGKAGETTTVRIVLKPTKIKVERERIDLAEKVYFDFNQSTIQARSYALLDEVAATLRAHPELALIEVAGHTDDIGSDAYNQELSQKRVDAVVQYLVSKGVDPTRLVAQGYGETKPVVPNINDANREQNRRVEIQILKRSDEEAPKP